MPEDAAAGATPAISTMGRVVRRAARAGSRWVRHRVPAPTDPVTDLSARIADLERDMQESRQMGRRLAEVIDVVENLLLPMLRLDDAETQGLLEHYSDTV